MLTDSEDCVTLLDDCAAACRCTSCVQPSTVHQPHFLVIVNLETVQFMSFRS